MITLCWVKRFLNNSQLKSIGKKARGPLPTTKKDFHVKCMIRIYRRTFESDADLEIKLPKEQQRTVCISWKISCRLLYFYYRINFTSRTNARKSPFSNPTWWNWLVHEIIKSRYWISRLGQATKGVIPHCRVSKITELHQMSYHFLEICWKIEARVIRDSSNFLQKQYGTKVKTIVWKVSTFFLSLPVWLRLPTSS